MRSMVSAILCLLVVASTTVAQDLSSVQIQSEEVAPGIHMLTGRGGNLGACVGNDGTFLIDDQFAPLTEKIVAAISELGGEHPAFVLNTHFHGDHTGGNENMAKGGSVVVAHDNVRRRMTMSNFNALWGEERPPAPEGNWPVVTFSEDVTFHFNDEEIHVFHVGPAHTDGDAVVHFKSANVIHAGDIFFNHLYPFIDAGVDGHIDGVVKAADQILELTDDDTRIIPGHGPLSDARGLREYRDMLETVADRIRKHVKAGRSLEETVAKAPTKEFDEKWGGGFLPPERFVGLIYDMMSK